MYYNVQYLCMKLYMLQMLLYLVINFTFPIFKICRVVKIPTLLRIKPLKPNMLEF